MVYKIIKKKLVFKNSVYKVYSNFIKSKDFFVKDFLSLEVKGKSFGGVCCIIVKNRKIGLMKVQSPLHKRNFFSLVQGFCDHKENSLKAIKREVLEETGISTNAKNFKYHSYIYPMHSLIRSKLAIYSVRLNSTHDTKGLKKINEIGVGEINFFDFSKVKKMLKEPFLFDLITFSALNYYLNIK